MPAADDLFRSRGLRQGFAEDVMSMALAGRMPEMAAPAGISFIEWAPATAPRFFAVWEAAFRERPGFPGWPARTWIDWIADDEGFRADWALLACAGDADLGFVAGGAGGWVEQVGGAAAEVDSATPPAAPYPVQQARRAFGLPATSHVVGPGA
ncbi:MAG TPA: hypothetical protein VGH27_25975 [Streptosporangiaceae bacterium]|jgi:hypothetical protein